jgi:hypothetical protein
MMSTQSQIVSRLRRLTRLWRRPAPPLPRDQLPITQTEPADVFIVAYPKSGSTWFQSLIAGVIYGLDPGQAPDRLTQDLVPDVHYKSCYKRYRTPMFFKSHHLPQPSYRRVVYLVRDGRDVLVSFRHHLEALERRTVSFTEVISGGARFACAWHEHVLKWTANPFDAEMLVIRYEDLLDNAVRELGRFCAFVDEPRDAAELARVAERASFPAMQRRERRFGWDNVAWPKDRPFVRRGIAGSHRDEMPPDAVAAFLIDAEPTLRQCGYVI